MMGGFLTMLFLYAFKINNPLGFNPLVWGLLVSLIAIIVVSKFTEKSSDEVLERYFGE